MVVEMSAWRAIAWASASSAPARSANASVGAAGSGQAKGFDWSRCRLGEGHFSEDRYVFEG